MQLRKADFHNTLTNSLIWRDVEGYGGLYKISYNGFVYSARSDKYLRPGLAGNGYLTVALSTNPTDKKTCTIHTMLAKAFIPNPENKKCVNHVSGNKQFNHLAVLEWATHGENNSHAIQTGLKKPIIEAKGCIQKDMVGNIVRTYRTTIEPEAYGFHSGNICLCCSGKRLSHGGYKWEYLNN